MFYFLSNMIQFQAVSYIGLVCGGEKFTAIESKSIHLQLRV